MRKFSAVAFSLMALIAAPTIADGDNSSSAQTIPTSTTTTVPAAKKPLRNNCTKLYSRKFFNTYADMVYSGTKRVNKHRQYRLVLLTRCQHTASAERWAKRTRRAFSAQNRFRRRAFCGSATCNKLLGMTMADNAYGSGGGQCMDSIVSREGGWGGVHQYNTAGSGAYGIPQALPGSKMASAGPRWRDDALTQIRWMIGYVQSRFGGMCQAWGYWQLHQSY